jgi:MYXO-CTERM domain-containing protein
MTTRPILALMGLSLALPACDLEVPPGDVRDPRVWGDAFLAKYADELVVHELEPGPAPLEHPRVVLLITGVTIPAAWFEPVKARLARDGFIPVVYEPPELLSGDLFENAELLGDVIDQLRVEYDQDAIDILAECTGGLIARHYVQSLGGEQKVSRLVTFISPQHGLPKAPLAEGFVGWPALHDLTPGSEFLTAVNDAPLPEHVPITSIYTCTDEYIQPYETSIIPGAINIGLCDGFVGHFQFFYDPEIYLVMHEALTQPLTADGDDDDAGDEDSDADGQDADDAGAERDAAQDDADQDTGCSVGGGGRGTPLLWALGVIGGLVRRRRSR